MILDGTLREGMQRYGVTADLETRWRILEGLARAGIGEAEIGVCGRDSTVEELASRARAARLSIRLSVWCPLREESIEHARRIRPDILNLSLPTSRDHIRKRLKLDENGAEDLLKRFSHLASETGIRLSLGFEDASRTHGAFLQRLAALAQDLGIFRLRPADTVGILDPRETASLVRRLRKACRLEIGFHGHNDFGMATANALAALDAGADCVDASLLGLGERAGIAATEELGAFLHFRRRSPLDPGILADLCRDLSRSSSLAVAPWKAVVGESLFHAESGMHVQGILIDPGLYEPFDPSRVGGIRVTSLGSQAGRSAVMRKLGALGIGVPRDIDRAVVRIREASARLGRPLEDRELSAIVAGR